MGKNEPTAALPPYITKEDGSGYADEKTALRAVEQQDLDPDEYIAIPWGDDGYAACRNDIALKLDSGSKEAADKRSQVAKKLKPECYYEVTFDERTHEHEPEQISFGRNGLVLTVQRGVRVVVPGWLLENAIHAGYPVSELDWKTKKIRRTGYVNRATFKVLRREVQPTEFEIGRYIKREEGHLSALREAESQELMV